MLVLLFLLSAVGDSLNSRNNDDNDQYDRGAE